MRKPVVAIVGRPNVGKSTLFNRILGRREAIVEDLPGVTRDRKQAEAEWEGRVFTLVDTGGFAPDAREPLSRKVQEQTRRALEEADLVLFLLDGREGLTPVDRDLAQLLRQAERPVLTLVNKVDGPRQEEELYDFYQLGLEELIPVSALHGGGFAEAMDRLATLLPPTPKEAEERPTRVALLGRPNVGKSSILNALLGEERVIVDVQPGTTRDTIDTPLTYRNRPFVLIDTAGIRRRGRIARGVETFSVERAKKALDRADVACLVLDAAEGVLEQDMKIAGMILEAGRSGLLVVNKSDLLAEDRESPLDHGAIRKREARLRASLPFLEFVPLLFVSAKTGRQIPKILDLAGQVAAASSQRIATGPLNQALQRLTARHTPPLHRGRAVHFYYGTQVGVQPPTFLLFVNHPEGIAATYLRYLETGLRDAFGFVGTPLRFRLRARRPSKGRGRGPGTP
jgi:GTP-binding protein